MAKFFGAIGYGEPILTAPGVWTNDIVEFNYYGDITRLATKNQAGDQVNDDLIPQHQISIVADAYANEHFYAIRYVSWAGTLWTVSTVEVQRPRLLLRLGGVYNGPKAPPPG